MMHMIREVCSVSNSMVGVLDEAGLDSWSVCLDRRALKVFP